jgi:hypothetical protein
MESVGSLSEALKWNVGNVVKVGNLAHTNLSETSRRFRVGGRCWGDSQL